MTPIDVTVTALGQRLRVAGEFEPSRPAITRGHPDNWEPADPAEWDDYCITIDGTDAELSDLLERVQAPGTGGTALAHVLDLAELAWLRERDEYRRAA